VILVTGAGGKTGRAVIKAITQKGLPVCALVKRPELVPILSSLGVERAAVGDMRDPLFMNRVFKGVRVVYHICPNMSPDEVLIAENAIKAACRAGVEQFIYHSVLHPQVEAMPHHWQKMRVEELLFSSHLPFTILQPGPYMQNVLAYWESIDHQGIYPIPYATSARLSSVDLEDVAEVASRIMLDSIHIGAIYELAGPEPLSQDDMATIIGQVINRPVEARKIERTDWETRIRSTKMDAYAIDTLLKMFVYYENYGLVGSSQVLEWLLKRPANRFANFIEGVVKGD